MSVRPEDVTPGIWIVRLPQGGGLTTVQVWGTPGIPGLYVNLPGTAHCPRVGMNARTDEPLEWLRGPLDLEALAAEAANSPAVPDGSPAATRASRENYMAAVWGAAPCLHEEEGQAPGYGRVSIERTEPGEVEVEFPPLGTPTVERIDVGVPRRPSYEDWAVRPLEDAVRTLLARQEAREGEGSARPRAPGTEGASGETES